MTDVKAVTAPTAASTPFDLAERRIWSGRAEAYARTYARLCAHPSAALLDAAEAGPGARVLDVGCGSGTVSAAAVARGASVYAADAEPGMAAATRRTVPGVTARRRGSRPCSTRPGSSTRSAPRRPGSTAATRTPGGRARSRGIGAIGQVLTSGGAEGVAAARRAYDDLCAEVRTRDGLLVLPHVALMARGRVWAAGPASEVSSGCLPAATK
ncbi:class I SAM-dependent methyltransferase [Streptomyces rubiginosohelvolus]